MYELIVSSISDIGLDTNDIGETTSLENIGLDSLMTVLLIAKLEEKLAQSINLDDFKQEDFSSIESILKFLNNTEGL